MMLNGIHVAVTKAKHLRKLKVTGRTLLIVEIYFPTVKKVRGLLEHHFAFLHFKSFFNNIIGRCKVFDVVPALWMVSCLPAWGD